MELKIKQNKTKQETQQKDEDINIISLAPITLETYIKTTLSPSIIKLLDMDALFANHCSLISDKDGPIVIRIKNTIMNDIICDENEPLDYLLLTAFDNKDEVIYLDLKLTKIPFTLRHAIGTTIIEYFVNYSSNIYNDDMLQDLFSADEVDLNAMIDIINNQIKNTN